MKKAPFKSPKNFLTTVAGMFGERTECDVSAYPPHRNRFAAAEQNLRRIGSLGKAKNTSREGVFFAPAAHRFLGIWYMFSVALFAGCKK